MKLTLSETVEVLANETVATVLIFLLAMSASTYTATSQTSDFTTMRRVKSMCDLRNIDRTAGSSLALLHTLRHADRYSRFYWLWEKYMSVIKFFRKNSKRLITVTDIPSVPDAITVLSLTLFGCEGWLILMLWSPNSCITTFSQCTRLKQKVFAGTK